MDYEKKCSSLLEEYPDMKERLDANKEERNAHPTGTRRTIEGVQQYRLRNCDLVEELNRKDRKEYIDRKLLEGVRGPRQRSIAVQKGRLEIFNFALEIRDASRMGKETLTPEQIISLALKVKLTGQYSAFKALSIAYDVGNGKNLEQAIQETDEKLNYFKYLFLSILPGNNLNVSYKIESRKPLPFIKEFEYKTLSYDLILNTLLDGLNENEQDIILTTIITLLSQDIDDNDLKMIPNFPFELKYFDKNVNVSRNQKEVKEIVNFYTKTVAELYNAETNKQKLTGGGSLKNLLVGLLLLTRGQAKNLVVNNMSGSKDDAYINEKGVARIDNSKGQPLQLYQPGQLIEPKKQAEIAQTALALLGEGQNVSGKLSLAEATQFFSTQNVSNATQAIREALDNSADVRRYLEYGFTTNFLRMLVPTLKEVTQTNEENFMDIFTKGLDVVNKQIQAGLNSNYVITEDDITRILENFASTVQPRIQEFTLALQNPNSRMSQKFKTEYSEDFDKLKEEARKALQAKLAPTKGTLQSKGTRGAPNVYQYTLTKKENQTAETEAYKKLVEVNGQDFINDQIEALKNKYLAENIDVLKIVGTRVEKQEQKKNIIKGIVNGNSRITQIDLLNKDISSEVGKLQTVRVFLFGETPVQKAQVTEQIRIFTEDENGKKFFFTINIHESGLLKPLAVQKYLETFPDNQRPLMEAFLNNQERVIEYESIVAVLIKRLNVGSDASASKRISAYVRSQEHTINEIMAKLGNDALRNARLLGQGAKKAEEKGLVLTSYASNEEIRRFASYAETQIIEAMMKFNATFKPPPMTQEEANKIKSNLEKDDSWNFFGIDLTGIGGFLVNNAMLLGGGALIFSLIFIGLKLGVVSKLMGGNFSLVTACCARRAQNKGKNQNKGINQNNGANPKLTPSYSANQRAKATIASMPSPTAEAITAAAEKEKEKEQGAAASGLKAVPVRLPPSAPPPDENINSNLKEKRRRALAAAKEISERRAEEAKRKANILRRTSEEAEAEAQAQAGSNGSDQNAAPPNNQGGGARKRKTRRALKRSRRTLRKKR